MSVDRTSLPVVGPDAPFRLPEFQRTALVDGTRLWTVRHRRAPVLTVCLLLPSGAAADPPGQAGLAALTADLLDEGSAGHSAIELHEALSRIGGRLNTVVTSDATVLSLTILARHAHRGLALLSEVATTPQFEVEDVERVRNLRLNRLRQLRQAPAALADRVSRIALRFPPLRPPDDRDRHDAVGARAGRGGCLSQAVVRPITLDPHCGGRRPD